MGQQKKAVPELSPLFFKLSKLSSNLSHGDGFPTGTVENTVVVVDSMWCGNLSISTFFSSSVTYCRRVPVVM